MRIRVRVEKIREIEGDCLDAELSPLSRSKFGGSVNIVPGYVEWRSCRRPSIPNLAWAATVGRTWSVIVKSLTAFSSLAHPSPDITNRVHLLLTGQQHGTAA